MSQSQKDLRKYYADLLALCQDASVRGEGYWGLKYYNRGSQFGACPDDLYTFARFEGGSGRLVLVVANFRPNAAVSGQVGIPQALADAAGLRANVIVRLVLDRTGAKNVEVAHQTLQALVEGGFPVSVANQTAQVYVIE